MRRLLSERLLCWKEAILASYLILGLLPIWEAQGCTLYLRTPDPRSETSKLKMTRRPQIQRRIQAHISQFHFNSLPTQSSPWNLR